MSKELIIFLLALFLVSCGSKENDENKEFSSKGTMALMEEVEKDRYTPPKDNNLTDEQVKMYLQVKQEAVVYAKQAAENLKKKAEEMEETKDQKRMPGLGDYMTAFKAMGDTADFVTADLRAAKKLGFNAKEYQWVNEVILKIKMAELSENAMESANKMHADTLEQLKKQRDAAPSEEIKDMMDQQIERMTKGINEMNEGRETDICVTPHNKQLLAGYKDEILGLEAEIRKWQMLEK